MKKNIFYGAVLIVACMISTESWAQNPSPKDKKTEEIIIRKNGDKDNKMTIQVNGDSITVNGKPLSEYHDGDVTIMKRGLKSTAVQIIFYGLLVMAQGILNCFKMMMKIQRHMLS